ncbi:Imm48 family immunity protein [Paenibacillus sp. FSL H8-0280]|uniref:Imm48 family immunity protein n=1 Tax=Paenibacillus TaxID=44249 RepID=UPI0011A9072A|nr:Imm48 family immunity protein [Paenibacillus xylanexedens]
MTDFLNSKFDEIEVSDAANELRLFSSKLFKIIGIRFEDTSEVERQVISAFCFGALNAIVQKGNFNQPQAHALIIALLINEFKYSEKQAVDFAEDLIKATSKDYHPVMNAIIHRGVDGYFQYVEDMLDDLKNNLLDVINTVNKKA